MRWTVVLAVAGLTLAATGCREGTVQITFRPEVGAVYRYEIRVETETEVAFEGEAPEQRQEIAVLHAEHTVLAAGTGGVRVRVVVRQSGEPDRTFEVRFDRAAQLTSIERIEGVPQSELAELGIPELFPAAAGAPPDRRLRPGERWAFADTLVLPGAPAPSRVEREGRLIELGYVSGEPVARVQSTARLRLTAATGAENGIAISGRQETEVTSTHDLRDGALRTAVADARGRFEIEVAPPPGELGVPVAGVLTVRVRSDTSRID